jgi:uncharacterized protein (TIRG00374 family)
VLSGTRWWEAGVALAILVLALLPLAWRWQRLLAALGIRDRLAWLLRAYFVSYTASQILPTSLGGDAVRIFETSRRHRGLSGPVSASVLLERGLGGVATLSLALVGFAIALGHYNLGPYVWLETLIGLGTLAISMVIFSRSARAPLRRLVPFLKWIRIDRPLRSLYEGLHAYRSHGSLLGAMLALTLVVQTLRILTIWICGKAVGVHLSPVPYFVMGPMFFLVMLAPFTVNGIALREAFFVNFLGQLGVPADQAFAAGFLYFLLALIQSIPGAVIWGVEGLRGAAGERDDAGTKRRMDKRSLRQTEWR